MSKVKMALCISANQADADIKDWVTTLVDRQVCETDETILQIIPYVILQDRNTGKIFQYTRGKAGQENRLHAKKSIGIGGHVDIKSPDIFALLASEAAREIEEETGIIIDQGPVALRLSQYIYKIIYTPDSEKQVDRVHIAVAFVVTVDASKAVKLEEGVILEPLWRTIDELKLNAAYENSEFENWSQLFITHDYFDFIVN